MRIYLVDNQSTRSPVDGAAIYVARLQAALAEAHRVGVVAVNDSLPRTIIEATALRRAIIRDPCDIVHVNNLSGPALALVLWAIGDRPALAMSIHDYRLLERGKSLNRSITSRIGLVVSPSHYALDLHRREGFFRKATNLVLPYGMPILPPPLAREGQGAEPLVFRALWSPPFSVAIQEAFRSGRVVIATRAGGIPEMVQDGVNGLLVEPGDEAGIAAAIERLRRSPGLAARLRASALETARLYDMRFHVAQLVDAYRELLTRTRTGDLDRAA